MIIVLSCVVAQVASVMIEQYTKSNSCDTAQCVEAHFWPKRGTVHTVWLRKKQQWIATDGGAS